MKRSGVCLSVRLSVCLSHHYLSSAVAFAGLLLSAVRANSVTSTADNSDVILLHIKHIYQLLFGAILWVKRWEMNICDWNVCALLLSKRSYGYLCKQSNYFYFHNTTNFRPITALIVSGFTHKMAIVSWRHFILCIGLLLHFKYEQNWSGYHISEVTGRGWNYSVKYSVHTWDIHGNWLFKGKLKESILRSLE